MANNKKNKQRVTEFLIRVKKLNIRIALITQSYPQVRKAVRINSTHFFIIKISNEREIQ